MAAVRSRGEAGGPVDERSAAEALGPPVGDGPTHLLLERQEQPGSGHEDEGPERVERGVRLVGSAWFATIRNTYVVRAVIMRPPPTANVPSGTASRALPTSCSARSFTRGNPGIVGRDERCTDHPKAA